MLSVEQFRSIPGWLQYCEGEELAALARYSTDAGAVVEIGSFKGRSTACLASGILAPSKVHAVDHFLGSSEMMPDGANPQVGVDGKASFYSEFHANLSKFGLADRVIAHVGSSQEIARVWGWPIRLLFIDAEHTYEAVAADYEAWKRWLTHYVCFHDYCGSWPGVMKFVDEIAPGFATKRLVGDMMVLGFPNAD